MNKRDIIRKLEDVFANDKKVWVIGNGGSSAEASHLSEEFISLGYPVIALNDPAVITALSNDHSYTDALALYLFAVAKPLDLLITISTSGKSKNLLKAQKMAFCIAVEILEWPRNRGKTTEEIQNNQLKLIHEVYRYFKDK